MTTYFPGILSTGALVPGLTAGTVRTTLGLGTADSPTFAGGTFSGGALRDGGWHRGIELLPNTGQEFTSLIFGNQSASGYSGIVWTSSSSGNNGNSIRASIQAVPVSSTTTKLDFYTTQSGGVANSQLRASIQGNGNFLIGTDSDFGDKVQVAGNLSLRNASTATRLEVFKTFTSATSNERLAFDTTAAGFLDIIAARGSLGGAPNGIRIGSKLDGGSFVPWLSFATSGAATVTTTLPEIPLSVGVSGQTHLRLGYYSPVDPFIQTQSGGQFYFGTRSRYVLSLNADAVGGANPTISMCFDATLRFSSTTFSTGTPDITISRSSPGLLQIGTTANNALGSLLLTNLTSTGTITGRASTTAADTAPIRLPTGVLQTTPEAGAIEYDGTNLYFTDSGGTRRTLAVV